MMNEEEPESGPKFRHDTEWRRSIGKWSGKHAQNRRDML